MQPEARAELSYARAKLEAFEVKVAGAKRLGWSPVIRQRFRYYTPDECYEAALLRLIDPTSRWLDVGCGRDIFPSNRPLAQLLSKRCKTLVGVDPSPNIEQNSLVHRRARTTLEEYVSEQQFDLVSLRMVAEHIPDPAAAVSALARLTTVGGKVVIYTVSKLSPSSLIAASTPLAFHHILKRLLWRTQKDDTFPTVYRMNTRSELQLLFSKSGFTEEEFFYLNDCSSFARWRLTLILELCFERAFRFLGLRYPEVCLLGVYKRQPEV